MGLRLLLSRFDHFYTLLMELFDYNVRNQQLIRFIIVFKMSRHSKNCTAHSIFTAGEKSKILQDHGTITARLGTESQKAFDECCLCLGKVREPMVCPQGHIFCKDCICENLVQQSKQIQKDKERQELEAKRLENEKARKEQSEMVDRLKQFNQIEMGVARAKNT